MTSFISFQKKALKGFLQFFFFAGALIVLSSYSPQSASPRTPRDRLIDDIISDISDLKQTTHCYKVEKEILEEKLANQEASIESLQQQLKNSRNLTDELNKDKITILERRIASLEKINEGLVADLRQFKTHANETAASLAKFQSKLSSLENNVDTNLGHMKKSLESLMNISKKGIASSITPSTSGTYRVKAGDTP